MKLYNTLNRKIDEVAPLNPDVLTIYSCGPTVYDHAHIGNLSSYIFADTLRRVAAISNKKIKHVMNYTDVDDKTIARSQKKYPDDDPKVALRQLTDEYISLFLDDMNRVGNDTSVLTFLRATDPKIIKGIQELISDLHKHGFAYITDDGVYFSIEAYRKSGKIYGQLLELTLQNTSEERIDNDEYDKASIHDFALWKKQKDDEPAWDFKVGDKNLRGRPGWHIECSVMSRHALGQPFDIHTGGVDLIFPHHENEIAQSTAREFNPVFAQYFVHNEHMLVDEKKMSKSLNNFYTLRDVIEKGFDPLAFRLLVLQSHYRSQMHFTWDNLGAAQKRLKRFRNFSARRYQETPPTSGSFSPSMLLIRQSVVDALEDDLNTPKALSHVEAYINYAEKVSLKDEKFLVEKFVMQLDEVFGLNLMSVPDVTHEQKELITKREKARSDKKWAQADLFRDELEKQNIGLNDTENGAIWYRL